MNGTIYLPVLKTVSLCSQSVDVRVFVLCVDALAFVPGMICLTSACATTLEHGSMHSQSSVVRLFNGCKLTSCFTPITPFRVLAWLATLTARVTDE